MICRGRSVIISDIDFYCAEPTLRDTNKTLNERICSGTLSFIYLPMQKRTSYTNSNHVLSVHLAVEDNVFIHLLKLSVETEKKNCLKKSTLADLRYDGLAALIYAAWWFTILISTNELGIHRFFNAFLRCLCLHICAFRRAMYCMQIFMVPHSSIISHQSLHAAPVRNYGMCRVLHLNNVKLMKIEIHCDHHRHCHITNSLQCYFYILG